MIDVGVHVKSYIQNTNNNNINNKYSLKLQRRNNEIGADKLIQLNNFKKQGRIHGNPVADDWAGAVMRKPLGIQKCDGPTDRPTYRPTDRHGKV